MDLMCIVLTGVVLGTMWLIIRFPAESITLFGVGLIYVAIRASLEPYKRKSGGAK